MKYRPEIDGLRAIAVLSVFLFHLGIKGFSGGFVGVDIFFVISGYLITGILQKDLDKDAFSIAKFYDRRIRRIFPALYLMLFFTFVVSYWLLIPSHFEAYCKSLVSSLLFYSNFQFWNESGYFDLNSEIKPLLHTWSLSIEEQFYIAFPTILYLLHRYADRLKKMAITALFLVSLGACVWLTVRKPDAGFYFSPVRAWELLLGAMLALNVFPKIKQHWINQLASIFGLMLVMYSVFRFSNKTSFPGYHALIPCLGTALLIHCTGVQTFRTWMDRFLSLPLMTGIGKISYSLYLWHWPAIVFVKYLPRKYGFVEQSAIVVMVFLLSYISWKYVEQPFRTKDGYFKSLSNVLRPLTWVTALLLVISIAGGYFQHGYPNRFSKTILDYANGAEDVNPDRENCHPPSLERLKNNDLCIMGQKRNGPPDFVLWGDSFADAMMPGFKELAEKRNAYGVFASVSTCAPLLGLDRNVKGLKHRCNQFNSAIVDLIQKLEVKNVVLVSGWTMSGYKIIDGSEPQKIQIASKRYEEKDVEIFYTGLSQTVSQLEKLGVKVWIFDSIVRPGFDVPDRLAMYARFDKNRDQLMIKRKVFEKQLAGFHQVLDLLRKHHSFELIDPNTILCPDECLVEQGGKPLFYDHQHLTSHASHLVEPVLIPFFEGFVPTLGKI
jgi:peptidoglycan/LPS O-acetylase OafA/YrhL